MHTLFAAGSSLTHLSWKQLGWSFFQVIALSLNLFHVLCLFNCTSSPKHIFSYSNILEKYTHPASMNSFQNIGSKLRFYWTWILTWSKYHSNHLQTKKHPTHFFRDETPDDFITSLVRDWGVATNKRTEEEHLPQLWQWMAALATGDM